MRNTYTVTDVTCDRCHYDIDLKSVKCAIIQFAESKVEMDLCDRCYGTLEDFSWGRNVEEQK